MSSAPPGSTRLLSVVSRFDAGRFIGAEVLLVVAVAACFSRSQSDTYWHLAAGRAMAQSGQVLLTDIFSHTNFGARWANYEWLSQVVFYHVHSLGGMPLLTAMCAALSFGSCVLAWRLIRGSVEDRTLILASLLPLITPSWSLRPQAFTMFLLLVVVHLALRDRLLLLAPIFILWANLHGAVVLGLVVLAADVLVAVASGSGPRRSMARALICLGATLLTPLGPSLWSEVWQSVIRSSVNQITEWMPPTLAPRYAFFWITVLVFMWSLLTRWARVVRREERIVVVGAILMLVLAVRASRNIVPFGLMAGPALSVLAWRAKVEPRPHADSRFNLPTVLRVLCFVLSLMGAIFVVHRRWTSIPAPADWVPISSEAASAIRACPGPIYNHFDVGGFIIWFVPEQKVFLDSRHNPYPDDLQRAQREARTPAALREVTERYGIRCAVVEVGSFESSGLRLGGWAVTYQDARWIVMVPPAEAQRRDRLDGSHGYATGRESTSARPREPAARTVRPGAPARPTGLRETPLSSHRAGAAR